MLKSMEIASKTRGDTGGRVTPPTRSAIDRLATKRADGGASRRTKTNESIRKLKLAVRRAIAKTTRISRRVFHTGQISERAFAQHWEWLVHRLLKFGGSTSGNSVKLFCDGDEMLEDVWQAIDNAQSFVWFEMYTLEPDKVGKRMLEGLANAAKRGCDVRIMLDAVGSSTLKDTDLQAVRDAGAFVEIFNPLLSWRRRGPFLRRDHRKIIIVDGSVGFCGGMNVSEEYAGYKYGVARFQDCHVLLQGPCVRDLCNVFAGSWRRLTDQHLSLPRRQERVGSTFLQVQASSGRLGRRAIQRALRLTTRHSLRHCYITTPYFVPPLRLIRALNRAAERGVDVRILTAGENDVPIVALAARHIYGRLLHKGVRIFEMFDTTLHAKTITIDGVYSTVGSFNLDTWSFNRNLEVNIAMVDPAIAEAMKNLFMENIAKSREMTLDGWSKRGWFTKLRHWLAYQILRI
jgi:cardiolipin synthase A/B